MKNSILILVLVLFTVLGTTVNSAYAQIDSRNQARPDKEQSASDNNKKKKKDKKKKKRSDRLSGRKGSRSSSRRDSRESGRKIYSNKKQIKQNSRKTGRAKKVERGYKGDITGRKQNKPSNSNRENNRSYSQPDPYRNRRIRTESSRAGPDAPEIRSATKRGERARTGDISGQSTVRQKSNKSAPRSAYPQPNPYYGRKIKTEKQRAKSNSRQIKTVRSVTRPAESRPPKTRSAPLSASAQPKVKRKRNVYRSHKQRGGERSTSKDIAGRKLRTKNTRSATKSSPIPYSSINPYAKQKRFGEGERSRRTGTRYSSARSISRSSESGSNRRNDSRYGQHRNRRTVRASSVVAAKSVRSTSDPKRRGEKPIYGNKYNTGAPRSVSRGGESGGPRKPRGAMSASGVRKSYKQRNTYRGKDRHFGEYSSTKDIAGRKLRTRNKRSFHPTWSEFGGGTYGTGSVSGKSSRKYPSASGRSKGRANWNNKGWPIFGKSNATNSKTTSQYKGSMPLSATPGYGPGKEGIFKGRTPLSAMPGYGPGKESSFKGRTPLSAMPGYGPGKEGSFRGRTPLSAMPGYGPGKEGSFRGRTPLSAMSGYGSGKGSTYRGNLNSNKLKAYKGGNESLFRGNRKSRKRMVGGGSITGFWNNKGNPLAGRGPGPRGESSFTGRMPLSATPNYGPGKEGSYTGRMPLSATPNYGPSKEGTYQGNRKGYRPLKGGGSITTMWNNKGMPLSKRARSPIDLAASSYKGDMPFGSLPSYGSGREGSYAGNLKGRRPLRGGGGSITKRWNNKEQPLQGKGPGKFDVGRYTGTLPLSAMPSYGDTEKIYQGTMKAKKPLKGGGGSITTHWNNKEEPLEGKGPGKYDVGGYTGNMSMSSLPSYDDGKEGSYQGTIKRKNTKIGQSPGTERGRTKSFTFLRIGDPNHMGLNHQQKHLKVNNDLPKELSRQERQRIEDSGGLGRGRTQSLSFLSLGNPTKGGLHAEMGNKKRKSDLPKDIKGKNRLRIQDSEGMDNGRNRSFTFWTIGDPAHGGLVRTPAQAKGRLHPSADYTKAGHQRNSVEEKDQPVKIRIWFAKLFKKNSNQPDAVKEKERRPRYNKSEREIWETAEREDWYKN